MTIKEHSTTPKGWGQDTLTQYIDTFRANQLATFANKRSDVIDLTTVDSMFHTLISGAINPRPMLPMNFLARAHSAFLAATGAVMAGQFYEAHALLRVCLEQGGYAHYIGGDQARWELWMARHDGPDQKKRVRETFTYGNIYRHIKAADTALGTIYDQLYERVIDYGGHPNERGYSLSSSIETTEDGGMQFNTIYLHNGDLQLSAGIRTTIQIGLCVLKIASIIYPHRVQAIGIKHKIETLSKRF